VLILLALSVFINYIDRGNLSIAAPLLKGELGLTDSQLGLLLSSFFWTYAMFQIVSGWMVDRFNVNWVIAGGFFLWSAATAATGLIHGFVSLMVLRLILGIGESVAYPSYSKILARHFPEYHRGLANALIAFDLTQDVCARLRPDAAQAKGWLERLVKALLEAGVPPERRGDVAAAVLTLLGMAPETAACRWARGCLLRAALGPVLHQLLLVFLLTWLPSYLVRERHFAMGNGRVGACATFCHRRGHHICGWLSDRWIAAGPTRRGCAKDLRVGLTLSIVIIGVSLSRSKDRDDPADAVPLLSAFIPAACGRSRKPSPGPWRPENGPVCRTSWATWRAWWRRG
jgi:sugar phosphate permease